MSEPYINNTETRFAPPFDNEDTPADIDCGLNMSIMQGQRGLERPFRVWRGTVTRKGNRPELIGNPGAPLVTSMRCA